MVDARDPGRRVTRGPEMPAMRRAIGRLALWMLLLLVIVGVVVALYSLSPERDPAEETPVFPSGEP